jgi:hypothetical protein
MTPRYYIIRAVVPRRYSGGKELVQHVDKKKVWLRIDREDTSITLNDVAEKIREIQEKHPELDVFFDGDEFAICSRPIHQKGLKARHYQMRLSS